MGALSTFDLSLGVLQMLFSLGLLDLSLKRLDLSLLGQVLDLSLELSLELSFTRAFEAVVLDPLVLVVVCWW
jgi:hypothetical protein